MNTYKVIWMDDCDERHESLVKSNDADEASAEIVKENENCVGVLGVRKVG